MATYRAINERTGKHETVELDSFGRVPAGYRVPTRHDLAVGRGASLREEIRSYSERGDVVCAEQAQRTLADCIATCLAV